MSDAGMDLETQRQEKMANLYKALRWNIGCLSVGWLVLCVFYIGIGGLGYSFAFAFFQFVGAVAGLVIAALPMLSKWMQSRSIAGLFNMKEYEVVTTYGDGRKTSDHGVESAAINGVLQLIIAGILLVLALALQSIRIIIMTIKYSVYYKLVSAKPKFLQTGFFVLIAGFAVFIGALVIAGTMTSIRRAAARAKYEAENPVLKPEEIRPILAQLLQQINSADTIEYYVQAYTDVKNNNPPITIYCQRAANTCVITVPELAKATPGEYTFTNNIFTGFEDIHSAGKQPTQADKDMVSRLTPANLFINRTVQAQDKDLFARKNDNAARYNAEIQLYKDDNEKYIEYRAKNNNGSYVLENGRNTYSISASTNTDGFTYGGIRDFTLNGER